MPQNCVLHTITAESEQNTLKYSKHSLAETDALFHFYIAMFFLSSFSELILFTLIFQGIWILSDI